MKEYLVYAENYPYESLFITQANNVKEAINKVFDSKFKWRNESVKERNEQAGYKLWNPFCKSDFKARSIGSLHNEYGEIVECDGNFLKYSLMNLYDENNLNWNDEQKEIKEYFDKLNVWEDVTVYIPVSKKEELMEFDEKLKQNCE